MSACAAIVASTASLSPLRSDSLASTASSDFARLGLGDFGTSTPLLLLARLAARSRESRGLERVWIPLDALSLTEISHKKDSRDFGSNHKSHVVSNDAQERPRRTTVY